jgi:hypothetical protein
LKGGRPIRRLYVLLASAVIATLLIALTMSTVSAQGVSKRYGAIAAVPSLVRGVDGYGATPRQAKSAAIKECRQFASHWRKDAGDCQGAVWPRTRPHYSETGKAISKLSGAT